MIIQLKWQIQGIRSDRVHEELWAEIHNIVQEAVTKTIPKKCKNANSYQPRKWEKWKAKEKGKDMPNWMQNSREFRE